jgi:hypothetical protein
MYTPIQDAVHATMVRTTVSKTIMENKGVEIDGDNEEGQEMPRGTGQLPSILDAHSPGGKGLNGRWLNTSSKLKSSDNGGCADTTNGSCTR